MMEMRVLSQTIDRLMKSDHYGCYYFDRMLRRLIEKLASYVEFAHNSGSVSDDDYMAMYEKTMEYRRRYPVAIFNH